MREGRDAVRGAGVDDAAVVGVEVVFWGAVEEEVEVRGDVQVGELEGAGQGEDQGDEFFGGRGRGAGVDVRWGPGGDAAGEGGVVVDVELEEVEEGVGYEGNRAVEIWGGSLR